MSRQRAQPDKAIGDNRHPQVRAGAGFAVPDVVIAFVFHHQRQRRQRQQPLAHNLIRGGGHDVSPLSSTIAPRRAR